MKRALAFVFVLVSLAALAAPSGPPDQTSPDGSRYWGALRFNQPHGKGTLITRDRDVYEGQFVDGQFTGYGRMAGYDGAVYEGEFRQWLFEGQGRLRLPNGDEYQGGFQRGVYEGQGTLKYASPRADGRTQETGFWHQGRLENAADRVYELTSPGDTVLVLPEDVTFAARIGRPRPALRGAIVFVDQYPLRLAESDIAELDRHPPKVVVMHPVDDHYWIQMYRIWNGDSGAERVTRHVLTELLPKLYTRDESYRTLWYGRGSRLDIWVRRDDPNRP